MEQLGQRLPVETKIFLTPPNALRLQWQSEPDGGWIAEVRVANFRNRYPEIAGTIFTFGFMLRRRLRRRIFPSIVLSTLTRAFRWQSSPLRSPTIAHGKVFRRSACRSMGARTHSIHGISYRVDLQISSGVLAGRCFSSGPRRWSSPHRDRRRISSGRRPCGQYRNSLTSRKCPRQRLRPPCRTSVESHRELRSRSICNLPFDRRQRVSSRSESRFRGTPASWIFSASRE